VANIENLFAVSRAEQVRSEFTTRGFQMPGSWPHRLFFYTPVAHSAQYLVLFPMRTKNVIAVAQRFARFGFPLSGLLTEHLDVFLVAPDEARRKTVFSPICAEGFSSRVTPILEKTSEKFRQNASILHKLYKKVSDQISGSNERLIVKFGEVPKEQREQF
jgi:hypothetical protein